MKICGKQTIIDGVYYIIEEMRDGDILHKTNLTVEGIQEAKEYLVKLVKADKENKIKEFLGLK